jgi:hypothetical protein
MTVDDGYMDCVAECIRLAGLTDDLEVRDELVELASRYLTDARDVRYKKSDNVISLRARRHNHTNN